MSAAPGHPAPADTSAPPRRARLDVDGRRDRLEQFHATLSEQVLSLSSSKAWTDWLATAARFHHYSFRNTIAIWMQRPDATQVAGYRVWQAMGRQVAKGEQGIQILAPLTRRPDPDGPDAPDARDAGRDPGRRSPAGAGQGDPPAGVRSVVGYRIAHVFDISQTGGEPLAQFEAIRAALLTGQAPEHLWDGLARQVGEAGYHLADEALPGGANGRTNYTDRSVLVRPGLDPAQRVKTLAHELGHVMLHEPRGIADLSAFAASCRGRKEVEAESVAFLVTSAHGMDSALYTFPYVAGWALQDNDVDVEATLRESAGRARSTAHRILDRLERDTPAPPDVAEDQPPTIVPTPRRRTPPERDRPAASPDRAPDVGMSR